MLSRIPIALLLWLSTIAAAAVEEISIVGLFRDRAIVKLDGIQRVLTPGKPSPEGVILISANSKEAVLEINGNRNTYRLGDHISSQFVAPATQKSVMIAPDGQGMYLVNGSINDFQVTFVVDTGATLIVMNKHQAKRFGLNYKLEGEPSISSTASGLDKIYIVKLDKVTVGDIVLNNIQGAVHDGDYPEMILLGNSFLSRITMQREGQLLKLEHLY
ncbi:MAG: aspartyl protease [Gammaproteobacteria bacterium]|nr:aspartyl protease [Gammaproteobacteria bacterium]